MPASLTFPSRAGGNDTITMGSGSAWAGGGDGYTTITGGTASGDDTIEFGPGVTTLYEGSGWNSPQVLDDSELGGGVVGRNATYTETGTWTTDTAGFNRTQRVHGAGGSDYAAWTFSGLNHSKHYDVYATWSPTASASAGATFSVYDGISFLDSRTLSQQVPPADDVAAGASWAHLGVFSPDASGTLTVRLPAAASGTVLADAVRIVRHDAAPESDLAITSFTVAANGLATVTYTVTGADVAPFAIGIYGSAEGVRPAVEYQLYQVSDPAKLTGSPGGQSHSVQFALAPDGADLAGLESGGWYLHAQLDAYNELYETSESNNLSAALAGGVFQTAGGDGSFLFDIAERYTPETRTVPTAEEVAPWVETIIRFWDDAAYCEHWSHAARQRAEAFRPEKPAPVYREFFSNLFPQPGPPRLPAV